MVVRRRKKMRSRGVVEFESYLNAAEKVLAPQHQKKEAWATSSSNHHLEKLTNGKDCYPLLFQEFPTMLS
jgi:hypothetical protein